MENQSLDWHVYEDRYKPIYSSIMHDLRHNYGPESVDEEQNNSSVDCDSDTPDSTICTKELQTIKYISKVGLRALSKDFSLNIKQHSRYPELFHISPDPKSSPAETAVVQECAYGLIVKQRQHKDGKNVEYHVVAMSYTKITEANHPFTQQLSVGNDFSWEKGNIKVHEKIDGKLAVVYFYKDMWNVCTNATPDGSEQIVYDEHSLPKTSYREWITSITINDPSEGNDSFLLLFITIITYLCSLSLSLSAQRIQYHRELEQKRQEMKMVPFTG